MKRFKNGAGAILFGVIDTGRNGDRSICLCRTGVGVGWGSCDKGSFGLEKAFVPLSEVIPRPIRLSRLSALDAPSVSAPTAVQMASQSASSGSSMTGLTQRKVQGEETGRGCSTRAVRTREVFWVGGRCFGIKEPLSDAMTLAEGLVEIRNGCTPLRSASSLSSSSPRFIIDVAGRDPWLYDLLLTWLLCP